jgi:LacI family transcriptional regulator
MTVRKRPLTLNDVASKAGVSQATVSLVLNGVAGTRISEQTSKRVLAAAEELGYRRAARVRADERYGAVIGMIIDDVSSTPFVAPLLEGAREAALEHQCLVWVASTRSHPQLEQAAVQSMLQQQAIGIIYTTLFTRPVTLPSIGPDMPVVLLNCRSPERPLTSIVPDDSGGALSLTQALLAAGHTRIGHLAGESWLDAGRERLAGYTEALAARGIPFDPDLVADLGSSYIAGRDGAHALLDLPEPPTGLVCYNDRMALGALDAARERGLRVPDDLSIVGFDNDAFVATLFPGLTTAELPHEAMARRAVDEILRISRGGKIPTPHETRVPCPVIRRRSIARCREPRPLSRAAT